MDVVFRSRLGHRVVWYAFQSMEEHATAEQKMCFLAWLAKSKPQLLGYAVKLVHDGWDTLQFLDIITLGDMAGQNILIGHCRLLVDVLKVLRCRLHGLVVC